MKLPSPLPLPPPPSSSRPYVAAAQFEPARVIALRLLPRTPLASASRLAAATVASDLSHAAAAPRLFFACLRLLRVVPPPPSPLLRPPSSALSRTTTALASVSSAFAYFEGRRPCLCFARPSSASRHAIVALAFAVAPFICFALASAITPFVCFALASAVTPFVCLRLWLEMEEKKMNRRVEAAMAQMRLGFRPGVTLWIEARMRR